MASSRLCFCFAFLCLLVFAFPLFASEDYYWDYGNGDFGPANWGTLHPEWRLCGDGHSQSPVAIDWWDVVLGPSNILKTNYDEATVEVSNEHALQITKLSGGGSLYWNLEGPYEIVNMHWHTPSEHKINGVRFPLEGHIVHGGPNNKTLVVGILYNYGDEDELLNSILSWSSSYGNVSLDDVTSNYYSYMGSLTTPPCIEGLTWIVLDEPKTISRIQERKISHLNHGNNSRPLQPLNGRQIYMNFQDFIALKTS